ncbi:type VII secretion protein EccB [Kitasatospora sp. MAA19]|uniref:type VII secretion protein EccB n=1 Tax=Kitasatospora sp. MAA19 TaxID=3035090 RepID=UPI002476C4A2|nr:type VII secretion protein EccB [Kitasatospora sp. MAA19]MDH6708742.1 type VII secretion protein EccB [Kitasatospora sp. MAA19]
MQSRRDQVQAHLFVMSRVSSGMLRAEPDAPDTPVARTTRGAVVGLAVGLLIGVGAGVYGLVKPGGATGWQKPGTLVVVEESGARYLYAGGQLRPVVNQASARLLAGDQFRSATVSAASLDGVPRGAVVGIVGAPDGLPADRDLGQADWSACAVQAAQIAQGGQAAQSGQTAQGARPAPQLSLAIGLRRGARPLTDEQAVLVAGPDGSPQLVWRGRRLRVDATNGGLRALGYGSATPYPVTAGFLDTLPVGPDVRAPELPGRGAAGPALAGRPTRIGQLFTGPGGENYLLTEDGLVPLGETLFRLVQGDPRIQQEAYGGAPVTLGPVGPADLAAHSAPAAAVAAWVGAELPNRPPQLATVGHGQVPCADLRPTAGPAAVTVGLLDAAAVAGQPPAAQPGVTPACNGADRIVVRPGGGALARAVTGSGAGSTLYLVTDAGVKYPLPSPATARQLGYTKAAPAAVPTRLLGLLPTGPSLDPAALTSGGVVETPSDTNPCGG